MSIARRVELLTTLALVLSATSCATTNVMDAMGLLDFRDRDRVVQRDRYQEASSRDLSYALDGRRPTLVESLDPARPRSDHELRLCLCMPLLLPITFVTVPWDLVTFPFQIAMRTRPYDLLFEAKQ